MLPLRKKVSEIDFDTVLFYYIPFQKISKSKSDQA